MKLGALVLVMFVAQVACAAPTSDDAESTADALARESMGEPDAAKVEPRRTDNRQLGTVGLLTPPSTTKPDAVRRYPSPPIANEQGTPRPFATSAGARGGEWIVVSSPPPGFVVGSGGAGPCIGVLVIAGDKVYAFHFAATDDPVATMRAAGPFPSGSHAALFGGDGSNESNRTLGLAIAALGNGGVAIDGYSNTNGLWVRDGKYVNFKNDVLGE